MDDDTLDLVTRFTSGGKVDLNGLRRHVEETRASGGVTLSNWRVQYNTVSSQLEANCLATPMGSDGVGTLAISVLTGDGSVVYCRGGYTGIVPTGQSIPSDISVQAYASTALYKQRAGGESVLCIVSGTTRSSSFYFEQTFMITGP